MDWVQGDDLREWLTTRLRTAKDVVLISPFVTAGGLRIVRESLRRRRTWQSLTIVTRLDPISVVTDCLDIQELINTVMELSRDGRSVEIRDCPNLHAKVFIVDDDSAVIGSGNLTTAGTAGGNIEIGVKITNKVAIAELQKRILPITCGRRVSLAEMERFQTIVDNNFADVRRILSRSGWGKLEIIPGSDGDYFRALRLVLSPLRNVGRSRDFVHRRLTNKDNSVDGSGTPERRLVFLEYLGLIDRSTDNLLRATDLGVIVSRPSGGDVLGSLLFDRYPMVGRVCEYIHLDKSKFFTYVGLAGELAIQTSTAGVDTPEFIDMQNAVRWLCSLKLAEREAGRDERHRLRFRATKKQVGIQSR